MSSPIELPLRRMQTVVLRSIVYSAFPYPTVFSFLNRFFDVSVVYCASVHISRQFSWRGNDACERHSGRSSVNTKRLRPSQIKGQW